MYINSAIEKLIVIAVLGHRISTLIVAERKRRKMDYVFISDSSMFLVRLG